MVFFSKAEDYSFFSSSFADEVSLDSVRRSSCCNLKTERFIEMQIKKTNS